MIGLGTRLTLSSGPVMASTQTGPTVGTLPAVDSGTARVGTLLTATGGTYSAFGGGSVSVAREWLSADVLSATGLTDTPAVADHGNSFVYRETATEVGGSSPGSVVRQVSLGNVIHVAPVVVGGLADLNLIVGSAISPVDISADFIGQDITIALTSGSLPAGLSFDGANLSGTPTGAASTTLSFTGTNSGGSDATAFQADVTAAMVTADIAPVMGALVGGVAITSEAGADGSYSSDFPGETFGAPTVDYRIDGGPWTASPGTATGGQVIDKRTTVTGSAGTTGQFTSGTITVGAAAPDAFVSGDWQIADAGTGGVATVTILALPNSNGDSINDVEYDVNASDAWVSGSSTLGFDIANLTDGVASDIRLRPVNGIGPGPSSTSKTVTTSNIAAPIVNSYSYDGTDTITTSINGPGDWYWMVDDNMTRTAAQVVAGGGLASGNFSVSVGANSQDIDLSLVAAGTHYLHGVPANIVGTSSDAQVQSNQHVFAGSVPAQMSAPTVSAVDQSSVSVALAGAPAHGSDAITSYDGRWSTDDATWTDVFDVADPFVVSGFSASTTVYVQTRAKNTVGPAAAWSASHSVATSGTGGATPTWKAAASGGGSNGSLNVAWPAGHAVGDMGVLINEMRGNDATNPTPSGWTLFGTAQTGSGSGDTKLIVYTRVAAGTSEAAASLSNNGNHQSGQIHTVDGAGSVIQLGSNSTGNGTAVAIAGGTTAGANRLIMVISSNETDTTADQISAWANSDLTSITDRGGAQVANVSGGGFDVMTGEKTTAGLVGNTTATLATSSDWAAMILEFAT